MLLENARVLLTGGCGGLGSAVRDELRRRGAIVRTAGIDTKEDMQVDFSDLADIERFCGEVAGQSYDILVNNAGLQFFGRTHEQPAASLHRMITVNLEAPIRLTQAVIPGMLARGRGQIVNIGSVFAAIPFPHFSLYSTTKAGIKAFSQAIRREYAGSGLDVTYIAPRALKTTMSTGPVLELLKRTGSAMDPPERVAVKIANAVEAGRRELSIGLPEAFFTRINALFPHVVDNALGKTRDIGRELLSTP